MNTGIRVEPLADHEAALLPLARLFESEWPPYYGPDGPGDAERDLREGCRPAGLPLTLVALSGEDLCGTVSLRPEFAGQPGPWVAALFVLPEHRDRGVAVRLIAAAEQEAKNQGIAAIYFGADDNSGMYGRPGWERTGKMEYLVGEGAVYKKTL